MNGNNKVQKPEALSYQHLVVYAQSVADELSAAAGLGVEQIHEALLKGGVWLSAASGRKEHFKKPVRIRSFDDVVRSGDKIHLNYDAQVLSVKSDRPVLISDQVNYSFWYKPAGVFSQGTRWGDHCSMPYLVAEQHQKPAYLVHRLDRAASGLMILAHTRNALKQLTALFEKRGIEKTYQARVQGVTALSLPLELKTPVDGKKALTRLLRCKSCSDGTSILTVMIETGRKHQIRSHLSSIGYPVVGDRLFDPDRTHVQNLQLVAVKLELQCPFTDQKIVVKLPDELTLKCSVISAVSDSQETPDATE